MEVRGWAEPKTREVIERELARANLLRMRGSYEEANKICLAVLETNPNDAAALGMLGDIAVDSGNADASERYYSSALEADSSSIHFASKLEFVRRQREEHETLETARRVGLPTQRSQIWVVAVAAFLLIASLGYAGFILGGRIQRVTEPKPTVVAIDMNSEPTTPPVNPVVEESTKPPEPTGPVPIEGRTAGEQSMLGQLKTALGSSIAANDLMSDPHSKRLIITVTPVGDLGEAALKAGGEALKLAADTELVTVRCLKNGALALQGEIKRPAAPSPGEPEPQPVLENLWTASEPAEPAASP